MNIGDCMKQNVYSTTPETTVREAMKILYAHHIGTLPVVDHDKKLVGLVRLRDLINLAMPDFTRIMETFDFVMDFGAVEHQRISKDRMDTPIGQIMDSPVSVEESTGLLRAAALLQSHQMSDLPVVNVESKLVGIASYVDIGLALISNWNITKE